MSKYEFSSENENFDSNIFGPYVPPHGLVYTYGFGITGIKTHPHIP